MKISVITACRNSEQTIEKTIQSVLSQDYPDIEYIIIDGASTDNTLKVIDKYKNQIDKLISEPDAGIYDALNKGIALARGEIIGFLHADDIYASENSLRIVADAFNSKKPDAVYGDLLYVKKENTQKIIRNWKAGSFSAKKIAKGWMPPHPTFLVRKKIYEQFGTFDIKFTIAADYDLVLRFLHKQKIKVHYIPQVLVKMRTGGESNKSLKNVIRKSKEDWLAMRKNRLGGLHTLFFKNFRKLGQFIKPR